MIFDIVTLTLKVDLLYKKMTRTMTFESEGFLIVAIYIWLPPASYVVFLTTLVIVRERAFIFGMCVPYDKTFLTEPSIFSDDFCPIFIGNPIF